MKLPALAGASSFAHLVGLSRSKARAEDDKKDDKDAKRAAVEDDEKDDDKKDAKAADESDDDKDDKDKDAKSKRAKAEDGDDEDDDRKKDDEAKAEDDDDDEEMHGKSSAARARRRERARCAAIFACSHAAGNVALAANLAFKTTLTRKEAIGVLRDTPASAPAASSGRADRNPRIGPAGHGQGGGQQDIAASWDAAAKKAGGFTRR